MHPDFGPHSGDVADARVQVVADDLASDSFRLERLLDHVGLYRVGCSRQTHDFVRIAVQS